MSHERVPETSGEAKSLPEIVFETRKRITEALIYLSGYYPGYNDPRNIGISIFLYRIIEDEERKIEGGSYSAWRPPVSLTDEARVLLKEQGISLPPIIVVADREPTTLIALQIDAFERKVEPIINIPEYGIHHKLSIETGEKDRGLVFSLEDCTLGECRLAKIQGDIYLTNKERNAIRVKSAYGVKGNALGILLVSCEDGKEAVFFEINFSEENQRNWQLAFDPTTRRMITPEEAKRIQERQEQVIRSENYLSEENKKEADQILANLQSSYSFGARKEGMAALIHRLKGVKDFRQFQPFYDGRAQIGQSDMFVNFLLSDRLEALNSNIPSSLVDRWAKVIMGLDRRDSKEKAKRLLVTYVGMVLHFEGLEIDRLGKVHLVKAEDKLSAGRLQIQFLYNGFSATAEASFWQWNGCFWEENKDFRNRQEYTDLSFIINLIHSFGQSDRQSREQGWREAYLKNRRELLTGRRDDDRIGRLSKTNGEKEELY
jgi:hypothetical protein